MIFRTVAISTSQKILYVLEKGISKDEIELVYCNILVCIIYCILIIFVDISFRGFITVSRILKFVASDSIIAVCVCKCPITI